MSYTFTKQQRDDTIRKKKQAVLEDLKSIGTYRSNCYLNRLIKEFNLLSYECSECGIKEWKNKSITLELDHIDGSSYNCKLSNLRYICPNCHSQTKTYKGKTINSGKRKVPDQLLIEALKTTPSIRQALLKVGLSPRGGNYSRASRLLLKNK